MNDIREREENIIDKEIDIYLIHHLPHIMTNTFPSCLCDMLGPWDDNLRL
jgi:hypothetical protein